MRAPQRCRSPVGHIGLPSQLVASLHARYTGTTAITPPGCPEKAGFAVSFPYSLRMTSTGVAAACQNLGRLRWRGGRPEKSGCIRGLRPQNRNVTNRPGNPPRTGMFFDQLQVTCQAPAGGSGHVLNRPIARSIHHLPGIERTRNRAGQHVRALEAARIPAEPPTKPAPMRRITQDGVRQRILVRLQIGRRSFARRPCLHGQGRGRQGRWGAGRAALCEPAMHPMGPEQDGRAYGQERNRAAPVMVRPGPEFVKENLPACC